MEIDGGGGSDGAQVDLPVRGVGREWSGESGGVDGGALGSGDAKFAYLTFLIWPDLT